MKAIQISHFGDIDTLVYEEVAEPVPGPGEVLIRVHAAGVNPTDPQQREGLGVSYWGPVTFPLIMGADISGEIVALGSGVSEFVLGDEVYGMLRFPRPGRADAEYTTAPVSDIALKPRSIDHLHAAGFPMSALTAWMAFLEYPALSAGQTVLVNGAAGGVGHFAVQMAKAKGARVIGVASSRNGAFLRSLGVDQWIDYTTTLLPQAAQDVDLVIDAVGGGNGLWKGNHSGDPLLEVLKRGGALVPVQHGRYSPERIAELGVTVLPLVHVHPQAAYLADIAQMIDAGALTVHLEAAFSLHEASLAHELIAAGHVRGKLVLDTRDAA
jgi:NADPH:quinone reductase-like Zn-dependent oxidoreductase